MFCLDTYALGASEKELVSETIMRRRRTQCWNIEYNFLEKHALSTLDLMVRYDEITTEGVQSLKHTEVGVLTHPLLVSKGLKI